MKDFTFNALAIGSIIIMGFLTYAMISAIGECVNKGGHVHGYMCITNEGKVL